MRAERTLLAATILVVCALFAGVASADSVALVWTAPGDDGNTGRASSYEMRYSETPVSADTASWWASAISIGTLPAPRTAGTRESFIVAGLAPGKTFYFGIRASDEVPNVSGFSNIARKQTSGGPVTLATPQNFTAGVTAGAVTLTWSAVPPGGPELGYRLYRKGTADPLPALLMTLPLSATSWIDSTVVEGTTYDFSLATYDDTAEGTPATLRVAVTATAVAEIPVVHGYPNPARDQVTFNLVVASDSEKRTKVTIFDLTGHKICILADQVFAQGAHALSWPCRSDTGDHVAPGIYNVIVDGPSGRAVTRVAIVP